MTTVLLHDSDCTSRPGSWRSTAAALPMLATELRIRGLQVRSLADHFGHLDHGDDRGGHGADD